jgi:predicted HAD superfamily Cof-like phosphohydrolase
MSDLNIKPILEWFQQAKPEPDIEDICVQIGCHYEEVAEMSESFGCYGLSSHISQISNQFKDRYSGMVYKLDCNNDFNRVKVLDDLCDQIVTAIGVAYMLGFDIEKALAEVNRSNWSKFVDGKPVFNEQGKIAKPDSYSPPELKEFIK